MRIRVLSDLHLECFEDDRELATVEADIVILAGDIHSQADGLQWAAGRFPDLPVLYVPGNHEYYGACMPELNEQLVDDAQRLGIHLLNNSSAVVGGVRFLGTTLWSDFELYAHTQGISGAMARAAAAERVPDFSVIEQPAGQLFTPEASLVLHRGAVAWLESELSQPFNGATVVISHHAPLADCIPPRYRGDALSPAFASRLEHLMGKMDLWVHGHVHEPVDLACNGTRVVANPGGYPDEFMPPLFRSDRVIEI